MSEQFKTFISQLSETNATLDYFTDFGKIVSNIDKISIKLNQLNYLIGKENLAQAVEELYEENPKVFEVLGILIAVRKNKKAKTFNSNGDIVLVKTYFKSPAKISEFIEKTGLGDIFRNKNVTNLVDYVFGIEVGLDTNARKNRGGTNMEKAVALIFDGSGILYKKEVNNTVFPEITGFGEDLKRFDFVVKTNEKTYLIEANYYNSGGSKLNETARSYSIVAPKINQYANYEFVWITDGQGWHSAKNKLEEAFNIIPNVYNLTTLHLFVERIIEEGIINF